MTVQWIRVFGPNLDKNNKARAKANQDTLDNPIFIAACEKAGITPTRRQSSKWNNNKGLARKNK